MKSRNVAVITSALVCILFAPAISQGAGDWVEIKDPAELRSIFSNKTHKGTIDDKRGTTFVSHYSADGKGVMIIRDARIPRTWAVKGNDQVCGTTAQGTDCWRYWRDRDKQNVIKGMHVVKPWTYQATVEDGIPDLSIASDAPAQTRPSASSSGADPLKVLFIGNSFTYYNEMPSMVAALVEASGNARPVRVKDVTLGGMRAEFMFAIERTRITLSEETWDYVVLQVVPYPGYDEPEKLAGPLSDIDSAIAKAGGKTVIYVTWLSRKYHLNPKNHSPQNPVVDAWGQTAKKMGALHAPVYQAWASALAGDPRLALYDVDGVHPSPMGSYLAACVIYLVIQGSQASCPSIPVEGARSDDLALLQKTAASVVYSSKPTK